MTIRKILIATVMLVCFPAFALIDAVELAPDNIILPATINGWTICTITDAHTN